MDPDRIRETFALWAAEDLCQLAAELFEMAKERGAAVESALQGGHYPGGLRIDPATRPTPK